ncbi:MAG: thiamine pyrophosphate-binding protein [Alphaproteobacteria bacterium]
MSVRLNGGDALVETLIANGVDAAFTVPGESFLTTLEAMRQRRDKIGLVSVRHESGASFAADAHARLTGRPAVAMVSRGPGATNAAIGLHTARQDSVPMLMVMGQVKREVQGREAFQEIDAVSSFASMAKAVLQPADGHEVAAMTAKALAIATEGRPGPVVLVMPRDVGTDETDRPIPTNPARAAVAPDANDVAKLAALLERADRPLIIAGEAVLREGAQAQLAAFAERTGAAVLSAYRCQDVLDNLHPHYAGHLEINRLPHQVEAIAEADLVLALGTRLDGITTLEMGAGILPTIRCLAQVYPDAEVLARFDSEIAVRADVAPVLAALSERLTDKPGRGQGWVGPLHDAYMAASAPESFPAKGVVDLGQATAAAAEIAGDDAITVTDGGSFARWVHRFLRVRRPGTVLGPAAGAMGYAVPGANGAALARPGARVLTWAGDGGFMMTGQELATAVANRLKVTAIVCDNGAQGSILAGQLKNYGEGHDIGTIVPSPDFAALARAYGAPAWTVETTAAFAPALREALAVDGPALLHLKTDRRDIAPYDD